VAVRTTLSAHPDFFMSAGTRPVLGQREGNLADNPHGPHLLASGCLAHHRAMGDGGSQARRNVGR